MYWQLLINDLINQHASNYHCRYLPQDENELDNKPATAACVQKRIELDNGHYLTQREAECVTLAIQGLTMKKIAEQLSLSPRTIEYYLKRIKERMGVKNKKELLLFVQNSCNGSSATA